MVLLRLQCLFLGSLFTAVHPEPPNECRENQYSKKIQCCNMCPPGQKMVNECMENINTECLPCGKGEFLETWNTETRCHPHRYCDPNLGLRVQREGTSETDTTCACDEGLHCMDNTCEVCALHSLCSPGFGVKEIATGVSDTICEPCLVGFFSSVSSAYEKCHPWTSCEIKGMVELQAGTNKTDAICGHPSRMRALVVIPIVTTMVFIVLLVSTCLRKVFKEADNKAPHSKDKRQGPEESEMDDFPDPCPTSPVQETLHWCQPVTQEDGKESRISVQERQ